MVDVIDFKDLSTHLVEKRDSSLNGLPGEEQIQKEKKSMRQLFISGGIFCVLIIVAYMYFHNDRPASGTAVGAYQAQNAPIFSSIRGEYKNLKDITCDEGERNDCITYTLTFYPQDQSQGGVVEGVTKGDVNRLGEYFNVILQSKIRNLSSRKGDLTFKIVSTNISPTEGESKVTYTCVEYYGQMQCDNR